jgi:hypothetical protein
MPSKKIANSKLAGRNSSKDSDEITVNKEEAQIAFGEFSGPLSSETIGAYAAGETKRRSLTAGTTASTADGASTPADSRHSSPAGSTVSTPHRLPVDMDTVAAARTPSPSRTPSPPLSRCAQCPADARISGATYVYDAGRQDAYSNSSSANAMESSIMEKFPALKIAMTANYAPPGQSILAATTPCAASQSPPGPFEPYEGEIANVMEATKRALLRSPYLASVKVHGGVMGCPTTVVAGVRSSLMHDSVKATLLLAKEAILDAATDSRGTYVLGYVQDGTGYGPFQDGPDMCSFHATLATVPAANESQACWDTYQKGFCPRRATCRWVHPPGRNLTSLTVCLEAVDPGKASGIK